MKILNIISAYTTDGGTINKLRTIVKHSKQEHQIYFYCYKHNIVKAKSFNDYYESLNIKTHYGKYGRNFIAAAFDIKRIIKENNIDIVHYYFNNENLTITLLKTICPKVKFIRSFVGYIELSPIRKFILNFAFKRTWNYIFISNYIKEKYEKIFPILEKQYSAIIYNCPINIDNSPIDINEKGLILYVGGLNKHKNVEQLIETMNVVVNQYNRKDIMLHIAGEGPERVHIEALISKYNLANNIVLLGIIKNPKDYYRKCSIYMHAATNEGFGISLAEAMFMKCACIVADASALKEVMSKECGYILPPNDPQIWAEKLIYLNDNKEIREQCGMNAYKRATTMFSRDKFIDTHDRMYDYLYKNGNIKDFK